MYYKYFLKIFFVLIVFMHCIPSPYEPSKEYDIVFVNTTNVKTTDNDTVSTDSPVFVAVWYVTGNSDCYSFYDSCVVKKDSVFEITIREKVRTQKLCLKTNVSQILDFKLSDSLSQGRYFVKINPKTEKEYNYEFFVD